MTLASTGGISPMVPVRTGGSCLRIALSVSVSLELRVVSDVGALSRSFVSPKSRIFTRPSSVTKTFSGLMSR